MDWPLLTTLPVERRHQVAGAALPRKFAPGEMLVREGAPAHSLHLVVSGHVSVRVATPDGAEALVHVLGPGSTVGELALVERTGGTEPVRSATVVALDAVTTRTIGADTFARLRREHPDVDRWLVEMLAARVRALTDRVRDLMFLDIEQRVYRALLELAACFDDAGPGSSGSVVVPLTQERLAEFVGATRPSVNQVLRRLAAHGVVDLGRGRVVVHSAAELRRLLAHHRPD